MSDFLTEYSIIQELKQNYINENNILQNHLDNSDFHVYKEVFGPKKNNDFFEDDKFENSELYYTRDNTNKSTKNPTQIIKSIFNISKNVKKNKKFCKKKRGRKMKQNNSTKEENNQNTHDKFSNDNLLRKIQIHYISFLISIINLILRDLNYEEQFLKLNYNIKKNINKKFFESLKNKKLSEIICNKISKKYKKYDSNINIKIYNKIKNNEILKNFFNILIFFPKTTIKQIKKVSENYLSFFKNIYYESKRIINLKKYGLEKEIFLSEEIKMFKDLLQDNIDENIDNKKYVEEINLCVEINYFSDKFC